ncbi:MAG: hypothetical protein H7Z72_01425 [Bacteroidetes bacterium]|nr:hypothetical protein [Fibrella sp.]
MSLTRKLHTETTESHAAQQMHSTMGLDPNLSQLNDKQLDNELTSRRADSADADGLLTVDESDQVIGETDDNPTDTDKTGPAHLNEDIDEARSASWGQPSATDNNTAQLNANQRSSDADTTEGHS